MSKSKRVREQHRREQEPRRHHLVPRSYLLRFAKGEHLTAIARITGERIGATVDRLAVETDFYAAEDADGTRSQEVEKILGDMENVAKHAMDRVLTKPDRAPAPEDRIAILTFVAFQFCRGSFFRALYNKLTDYTWHEFSLAAYPRDRHELRHVLKERNGQEPSEEDLDQLLEMLEHPDSYEIEPHQNESLMAALSAAVQIGEVLLARTWNIVRFAEPMLVTSDEPVSRWSEPRPEDPFWSGGGIADCDEVRLPLDTHHMLILTLGKEPFGNGLLFDAEPKWARNLNYSTIQHGHRWVFAHPDHPGLALIEQTAREAPRRGVRVERSDEPVDIIPGEPRG